MFKSSQLLFCTVLIAFSLLSSCKKEETPEPDPNDKTAFIEFTIDGTVYRIDASNTTVDGSYSAQYTQNPPVYILVTLFNSPTNAKLAATNQSLTLFSPFEAKAYPDLAVSDGFNFAAALPNLQTYSIDPFIGKGSIEFTHFDTASGGRVEGTFSITSMVLKDKDQNEISKGHVLTQGSFRYFLP